MGRSRVKWKRKDPDIIGKMMTSAARPEIGEEWDLKTLILWIYLLTTCLIVYL